MKAPDPENLRRSEDPALVDVKGQGPVYVARASTTESGWLKVREWDGARAELPPHRVLAIRRLETKVVEDDRPDHPNKRRVVADPEWREQAKDSGSQQEVIA
jgi:hypothetical protein